MKRNRQNSPRKKLIKTKIKMTLEKIKERQEQINNRLTNLLEDQENLITTLLGARPVAQEDKIVDYPKEGLIQQLNFLQDGTESIIARIYSNFRELQDVVYEPVKVQG